MLPSARIRAPRSACSRAACARGARGVRVLLSSPPARAVQRAGPPTFNAHAALRRAVGRGEDVEEQEQDRLPLVSLRGRNWVGRKRERGEARSDSEGALRGVRAGGLGVRAGGGV